MLKRILVTLTATDCGQTAVRHAVELATAHDARLTGVTLVDPRKLKNVGSVPVGAGAAARQLREHRLAAAHEQSKQMLSQFQAVCREAGVEPRVEIEEGEPSSTLLSLSRYHDLVIFGLRGALAFGHTGHAHGLVGTLVSRGVRPMLAASEEYRPIRRALIAYSGSMESAKTLRRFAQIDPWPEVETEIAVFGQPGEGPEQLLHDAQQYCRDHRFATSGVHIPEDPRSGITRYADQHEIDLIVMGYSTRTLLSKVMMRETGIHVLRHTTRSVFLCQ